jgi:hypothetical protein
MHRIRPYKLFTLIEAPAADRIVSVKIPHRRDLKLLETFLLIAACRLVDARRLLEFGTFLGSTTLNLALNTPDTAEVLTFDLDQECAQEAQQHPADVPITQTHLASESSLDFLGSPVAGKIKALTGNSTTFNFSPWKQSIDMIFIDGGHDLTTVTSDTLNSMELVSKSRPSCIWWHDYGNPDYEDLSQYLNGLSERMDIFHIEDTMLCGWFNDPQNSIVPRLLTGESL